MCVNGKFLRNVVIKGLILFLIIDLAFISVNPSWLGKVSLYNRIFPGRERFPFGENPSQAYNLSLFDLEAMFASHVISAGVKPENEFRVIIVGDSSTWGTLLRPGETLAGLLDQARINLCGKTVRVYNLGYPTISLTKDLMILDYAMRYQPDLIIWPVTLEAFPVDKQLSSPIVANNADRIDYLISKYHLPFDPKDAALVRPGFFDRSLIGQRRALADLFRLQMYGVLWAATGIDQTYPTDYTPAQLDYDTDVTYHGMKPPFLDFDKLAHYVLSDGLLEAWAAKIPVILINEPILISQGQNSDLRYDFFYPRWAYDFYRQSLVDATDAHEVEYLDLWNLVPADQFTNSAIHLTPAGEELMAAQVEKTLVQQACP
jgi:hypothetical protein